MTIIRRYFMMSSNYFSCLFQEFVREREKERVERRGSSWSQFDRARCREGKEELGFPIEVPPLMWPPLP